MQPLNFKKYSFRFKSNENKPLIFDPIRKKFMVLTPEEWVRQHVLKFLINEKEYPISHINVEKQLELNGTKKRYDIVVFNNDGSIHLIVECKRPKVAITQTTFDQIARYNMALNATYLMVTNGIHHYYCRIEKNKERYVFLEELPTYQNI
ncbi:type I restriction enzyme HsdR N-terminal domain-containing protein [Patiriisocius hiemis]|uniref:Type I restriction enzyme HsdR N-terminal domain-containing protein n=1 Tax=Patiriisocius hiemis TaxID=3075604 RepID=A0ABU2Y8V6_9FLAO|nr:type I restriction enzyme HsdR N-terminal domain-containing protein [Constantimarinum sp. W242]MDT0554598.1 type I restriction enzyme HsdR N-terminal domain-containing protein [Constantimarinum sp. W242]